MEKYYVLFKKINQIALAQSVKIFALAVVGWVGLYILFLLAEKSSLAIFQGLWQILYVAFIIFLGIKFLSPLLFVYKKYGRNAFFWLVIFLTVYAVLIYLVFYWLLLSIGGVNSWNDIINGNFNVIINLG